MPKYYSRIVLVIAFVTTVACLKAKAAGNGLTVSVGDVTGTPNGEVAIPLMLNTGTAAIDVGAIEVGASFKSGVVTFTGVKKGFLLEGVGGDIDAQQKSDPAKSGTSKISVKGTAKGNPPKSLPSGLLFTFLFHVAADAKPGTKVPIKIEKAEVKDMSNPPLVFPVTVEKDGGIQVITPDEVPVTPCFFFSH